MKAIGHPFKKIQRIHENFRPPKRIPKIHDGLFRKSRKLK
jgi:hypothetical protein